MKHLERITELILAALLSLCWLFGFVLAKGFWSTLFCFIPFYAWYLVAERSFIIWGLK